MVWACWNVDGRERAGAAVKIELRLTPAMKTDDTTLSYHAVHAGLGIAYLPEWLVADDLRAGTLKQVLPRLAAPPLTLFAAYTSRKYMTAKVRSFIDFVSAAFATPA